MASETPPEKPSSGLSAHGLDLLSPEAPRHAQDGCFDDYELDKSEIELAKRVSKYIAAVLGGVAPGLHIHRVRMGLGGHVTVEMDMSSPRAAAFMHNHLGNTLRFKNMKLLAQALGLKEPVKAPVSPPGGVPPMAMGSLGAAAEALEREGTRTLRQQLGLDDRQPGQPPVDRAR